MRIVLNGEEKEVREALSLFSLVQQLGLPKEGVALAVNRQVVPRAEWTNRCLNSGDRVEIVRAVGGG